MVSANAVNAGLRWSMSLATAVAPRLRYSLTLLESAEDLPAVAVDLGGAQRAAGIGSLSSNSFSVLWDQMVAWPSRSFSLAQSSLPRTCRQPP